MTYPLAWIQPLYWGCVVGGYWSHPARYSGGIFQLHYARAQELGPWLDLVAVRGEVVVQFWSSRARRR